jgi:hypothetical protein
MKSVNFKKKAGRPAKEKATLKDVVVKKSKLELDYEDACNKIDALKEDSEFYESKLYEERKNLEDLFKELDKCIYDTIHHCSKIEMSTGEITLHDVDYCVDLIKRIMKYKFESKPENY